MTAADDSLLAGAWLRAVREDAALVVALEGIYQTAAAEVARRGPACWASGRCCNFERAGHRLYVTGLEAAYCVSRLEGTLWAGRDDERVAAAVTVGGRVVTPTPAPPPDDLYAPVPTGRGLDADLDDAIRRGGCPFQVRNLCGVHAIKPLGCRVYFCDRGAEAWQQELSERLLREIRALHDRHGVAYRYGEWRAMLGMFAGKG